MQVRGTLTPVLLAAIAILLAALTVVEVLRLIDGRRSRAAMGPIPFSSAGPRSARQATPRVWDPFAHVRQMQAQIDRLFQSTFTNDRSQGWLTQPAASRLRDDPAQVGQPPLLEMQKRIDAMFQRAFDDMEHFGTPCGFDDGWESLAGMPAIDLREDASNYVVTVSLPAVDRSGIHVNLDGRFLTIVAEQSAVLARQTAGGSVVNEIVFPGRFERRILLPGTVSAAREAQAAYAEGVLHVRVPKADSRESLEKHLAIQ